jgi:hypothetical protein
MSSSRAIGAKMRAALGKQSSNVMLGMYSAILAACPVRTGHLLNNFILSTGVPNRSEVDGSAVQAAGLADVESYDVAKDGAKLYLTNNVEYLRHVRPFIAEALAGAPPAARRSSAFRAVGRAAHRQGR